MTLAAILLKCASILTPSESRSEWLAEWTGELRFVFDERGRGKAFAFAMGGLRDALWMRRNRPNRNCALLVESPVACVLLLAAVAIAAALLAPLVPLAGKIGEAIRSPTELR